MMALITSEHVLEIAALPLVVSIIAAGVGTIMSFTEGSANVVRPEAPALACEALAWPHRAADCGVANQSERAVRPVRVISIDRIATGPVPENAQAVMDHAFHSVRTAAVEPPTAPPPPVALPDNLTTSDTALRPHKVAPPPRIDKRRKSETPRARRYVAQPYQVPSGAGDVRQVVVIRPDLPGRD